MTKRFTYLILFAALCVSAAAWETFVTVDAGRAQELTIGMAPSATAGFDRELDMVAPPLPPVGFYCYFTFSDTNYEFINALWADIRPPAKSDEWQIRLHRPERPARVHFSGLPEVGLIKVNNVPVVADSFAMTFGGQDSILKIAYSGGFYEEPNAFIEFEVTHAADAIIVIHKNGKSIRRLPDMFLAAGEHSLGWNALDNRGNPVEPGLYYAYITLRWENENAELEVETIVKE